MSGPVDVARAARPSIRGGDRFDRPQLSQVPYLPGLDGIRALAVVAVMVYHANSDWLAGGYLGVEVFFVISGYLITLLIIAEHERTGGFDLRDFWIRRAKRLLPAVFLMMLLLTVWVALFERDALGQLRGDVIAGVLYSSNWYQIWIGAGYSAGSDFAPLRHLWSLAVEEQFYLLWPLAMLVFVKAGSRKIARLAIWLFLAAVAINVLIALVDYSGPQQTPELTPEAYWFIGDRPISKPDFLYLSTFTRAGGLLLGAAFAMVWRPNAIMRGPLASKGRLFDVLGGVGIAVLGIMAVVVTFDPSVGVHDFLFNGGLFVTGLASLALVAAVTHRGTVLAPALSNPVLLWIGTRSYGLYLYHWPIYQIIRNIAANKLAFHEFVLAMVVTCVITEASYRWVETPIRRGTWRNPFRRSRRSGGIGVAGGSGADLDAPVGFPGGRPALVGGAVVGVALTVFAGASLATAELRQNEVAEELASNQDNVCDVLVEDCSTPGDDATDLESSGPVDDAATVDDGASDGVTGPGTDDAAADPDGEAPDGVAGVDDPAADDASEPTATTAPPTTAALPPVQRLAVGDSVMLGAAEELQELGFAVNAAESRSFGNGLDVVTQLASDERLGDYVVVHLGTNGPIDTAELDQMMAALQPVPNVVLVENDVDRNWEAGNNAALAAAAAANPNAQLLYWSGLAGDCSGDCIYNDGIHLKSTGARYYSRLLAGLLGLDVPESLLEPAS
ncbi:MAG: acyltransferase family protein [Actinomycetota bacterium]